MSRVVPEALALDLPADVLDNYLYNNARGILLRSERRATGALTMDRYELRRLDYSLSEDHDAICRRRTRSSSRPTARSRRSVPQRLSGFDKSLWERLCAMGATTMALPESVGGDGATLVDLDPGGRGDRPVAGAGAVDRPRVRGPAAGPARRAGRRHRRRRRPASSSPGWTRGSTARRVPG